MTGTAMAVINISALWCESTLFSWVDSPDQENGSVERLGSPERKWGVPGE